MSLFFIHVTKTAGGTIKRMLREWDGGKVQFHYPNEENFSSGFEYSKDTNVIYGHYRYGAHELMGVEPDYACFVREPVTRTISHFNHLKNVAKTQAGDRARKYETIDEFIKNTSNMDLDNLQTRMLSGIGRDVGYNKLDDSALQQAVENLSRTFSYIGIFEDLQNSVDRLGAMIPGLGGQLPHVNKGKYEAEMSSQALDLVKSRNQLDLRLYEEAVRLATRS